MEPKSPLASRAISGMIILAISLLSSKLFGVHFDKSQVTAIADAVQQIPADWAALSAAAAVTGLPRASDVASLPVAEDVQRNAQSAMLDRLPPPPSAAEIIGDAIRDHELTLNRLPDGVAFKATIRF